MKKILFVLISFLATLQFNGLNAQDSFTVNGDLDKFYPVVFSDANWYVKISELDIIRADVHMNSTWRGSVVARFTFHTNRWGNGSNFINAEIHNNVQPFIAGWRDATYGNGTFDVIIWLKGGGTTYFWNSDNGSVPAPIIYDGVANPLPYQQVNGPAHSYMTEVDPNITSNGLNISGDLKVSGSISSGQSAQTKIMFPMEAKDFNAAPRVGVEPMTIKLWDNYQNGGPSTYGSLLEMYGRANHMVSQLYFGGWDNSRIWYREAFYGQNTWNSWRYLLDSKNNVESEGLLRITGNGNHYIQNGNVGIGTTNPQNALDVRGTIHASRVIADPNNWSDFVFAPNYQLRPLAEVEQYIKANNKLPEIPSAKEVEKDGVSLGDMQAKLLQKVEELTLYMIELKKEVQDLKNENTLLKSAIQPANQNK